MHFIQPVQFWRENIRLVLSHENFLLFGVDLTIYERTLSHPELNFEAKLFIVVFISEGLVKNKNKDDLTRLCR